MIRNAMEMMMLGLIGVAGVSLTNATRARAADDVPQVGEKAPEFEMQASDGKTYRSADLVGERAYIIAWFPRAFTGGCTKECKSMKEFGELLQKFDVAYCTASTDPVEKNTEFAKSLELDYPILSDPSGKHAQAFGVLRSDRNAAARVSFIVGKDGKVLAVIDDVKTETHGKDLAMLMDKLEVDRRPADEE